MDQCLTAFALLTEDITLVPSIYIKRLITTNTLFWPPTAPAYTIKIKKDDSILFYFIVSEA